MLRNGRRDASTVENPDLATEKIRRDPYLRTMYSESLEAMVDRLQLASLGARVVEIGAAGGITKDLLPWIETSDVRDATGVDRVFDGE